jgi:hypothetical protein
MTFVSSHGEYRVDYSLTECDTVQSGTDWPAVLERDVGNKEGHS